MRSKNGHKRELTVKQAKYIAALGKGDKSKKAAALAAGYAPSTALRVKQHVETPNVRAAFAELIRKTIPQKKIAKRIQEGLDAMETKFFQKDGIVMQTVDVINYSERREYTKLAAEYGGFVVPQRPAEAGSGVNILLNFQRDPMPGEVVVPEKPQLDAE